MPSPHAASSIQEFLDARDLPITHENLDSAFAHLKSKGLINTNEAAVQKKVQKRAQESEIMRRARAIEETRQRNAELARVRFSAHRQMDLYRQRSTDELIDWLSSPAKLGGPLIIRVQLAELVIHQQDVRRPLGAYRSIPGDRLAVVLDFGISPNGLTWTMAFSRRRAKGLRLVASDIEWAVGEGPEVRGPGEALLMALNGRAPALAELEGDGVPVLASRVP